MEKNPRTNQLKLVDCGCVKTHASSSTAERLKSVYDGIAEVIKKYKPDEVAVEELFFVQNVKTGIVVGQARGVLLLTAALAGKPVFEYKPTQIKMALVGYGRADKKQVQNMVKLVLKLKEPIKQDDTADAVAVAICHINHSNQRSLITRQYTHSNNTAANDTRSKSRESDVANDTRISHANNNLVYPELSYEIVGALQGVSNEIGFVLNEKYYYPHIEKEFTSRKFIYQKQVPVKISLEGISGRYFIDYVVDDKIVLEIKIGSRFAKKDVDQVMGYLRATGMKLGILARFTRSGVLTKRFLLGNNNIRV